MSLTSLSIPFLCVFPRSPLMRVPEAIIVNIFPQKTAHCSHWPSAILWSDDNGCWGFLYFHLSPYLFAKFINKRLVRFFIRLKPHITALKSWSLWAVWKMIQKSVMNLIQYLKKEHISVWKKWVNKKP
jgi:hypothetical protein